jgi:predicted small metal-binding protein
MGTDCDFVAEGNTAEEVKSKMMDHAMKDHKEMMDKMSDDEKSKMMMKMDNMLKSQR